METVVNGHITTHSNSSYIVDYTSQEAFYDTDNLARQETPRVIAFNSDYLPQGEVLASRCF